MKHIFCPSGGLGMDVRDSLAFGWSDGGCVLWLPGKLQDTEAWAERDRLTQVSAIKWSSVRQACFFMVIAQTSVIRAFFVLLLHLQFFNSAEKQKHAQLKR